jgi:putative addiction module killer protein
MALNIVEYVRQDGVNPYRNWFEGLPSQAAVKVATATLRLQIGNTSSVKWFSGIGEYRIDWGPGYRIYLAKDGDSLILLLGGGTKKNQHADIERAKLLWAEYKLRKNIAKPKLRR